MDNQLKSASVIFLHKQNNWAHKIPSLKVLVLAFGALVFFGSCGVQKTGSSTADETLSFKELQKFNYYFFEASKKKILTQYDESIALFEKALEVDPTSHATMFELSRLYRVKKQAGKAIFYNEQAAKTSGQYQYWYLDHLMRMYAASGQLQKASGIAEIIIDNEPFRKDIYPELISYLSELKAYDKAIKIVDRSIDQFGISEETARQKEYIYFHNNKPEEAVEAIKELLDSEPKNVAYMGLYAEILVKTGQLNEAIQAYEDMLNIDPDNGYAFFGLADIYRSKEMEAEAFEYLRKGFEDVGVNLQQKLMVMQSYMPQLKNSDLLKSQAFQLARTMLKVHPTEATPSVVLSDIFYEDGQKDSSIYYLESALDKQPSDFRVWQRLFSLLEDDKDYKTLVIKANEALELFPNQVLVYSILSSSHYYLEQYQKAIDAASVGLDFSVNMQSKSNLLTIMAESYSGLERLPEAFETYERILALDNNNALVLNNYAYLLSVKNQQLERAATMVQRALELDPGNSSYIDTYGWVLYQLGRLDEAKIQLEKAYASHGESSEVINHYAEVLYKLGEKAKAAELWQKSLNIDADQPSIKSKLNEIGS